MWYLVAWLVLIAGLFSIFTLTSLFFQFCFESGEARKWWGGFSLWMAGCLGVIVPLIVGLGFVVFKIAFKGVTQ